MIQRRSISHLRPAVLIVIENVPLARDHRARKQVQSLLEAGYEVSVVCRSHPDNRRCVDLPGVHLYEYPSPRDGSSTLSFVWEYSYSWFATSVLALRAFARHRFRVIQIGQPPDISLFLAAPFKLAGCRLLVDQRDLSPEVYAARYARGHRALVRVLRAFERLSWRGADHVLCVNGSLRREIMTRGSLPEGAVTIVGNGPRLSRTSPRPRRVDLKRNRRFLVCWLGLIGPQDRADLALWAVHHLVHTLRRTDCHLALVGEGESLPDLRRLASRLSVTSWISFTGWLDEERCFEYLSGADVGLDTNLSNEVTPVKGMEYMAFALPFVAFDAEETRTMAEDAAVYVDPTQGALGLARAIDELLTSPARRAEMGHVGRRRIEQQLAWDLQKDSYLAVYERLLPPRTDDRSRSLLRRPRPTALEGVRRVRPDRSRTQVAAQIVEPRTNRS